MERDYWQLDGKPDEKAQQHQRRRDASAGKGRLLYDFQQVKGTGLRAQI